MSRRNTFPWNVFTYSNHVSALMWTQLKSVSSTVLCVARYYLLTLWTACGLHQLSQLTLCMVSGVERRFTSGSDLFMMFTNSTYIGEVKQNRGFQLQAIINISYLKKITVIWSASYIVNISKNQFLLLKNFFSGVWSRFAVHHTFLYFGKWVVILVCSGIVLFPVAIFLISFLAAFQAGTINTLAANKRKRNSWLG